MKDDDISLLLKTKTPYLNDDGFAERVTAALPLKGTTRARIVSMSWIIAFVLGAVFITLNRHLVTELGTGPVLIWAFAAFGLMSSLALFVYVAIEEEVFEL